MTFSDLLKRAEKVVVDNSPVILTVLGVTGALTTAYLTGRASFKAARIIDEYYEPMIDGDRISTKEAMKLVWKLYIPAVGTGVLTVAAIVGANKIGTRRAAALAAAYSISQKAFEEYREKIIEKIGEKKEQAARDEIAQDRVNTKPPGDVIFAGEGSVLCFEAYTGRYFLSDMETLRKAQNDINAQLLHDGYASLSDLYDMVDIPHTSVSDEMGWTSDHPLEMKFSAVLTPKSVPCISMAFAVVPTRHF